MLQQRCAIFCGLPANNSWRYDIAAHDLDGLYVYEHSHICVDDNICVCCEHSHICVDDNSCVYEHSHICVDELYCDCANDFDQRRYRWCLDTRNWTDVCVDDKQSDCCK